MDMRICPDCNKAFYYLKDKEPSSCTHCGYFFGNKRQFKRIDKRADCVFTYEGIKHDGLTKDYSLGGACIEFAGEPIREDASLDFKSDMLGLHASAKAVWSLMSPSKGILMGLKFLSSDKGA